jgi:hypothetical protein
VDVAVDVNCQAFRGNLSVAARWRRRRKTRGVAVEMHRLRIELRRERLDGVGGDEQRPGFDDLSDGEILVAAHRLVPAR